MTDEIKCPDCFSTNTTLNKRVTIEAPQQGTVEVIETYYCFNCKIYFDVE